VIKKLMEVQSKLIVKKDKQKSGIQFKYRTAEDILERAKHLCIEQGLLLTVTDKVIDCCGSPYIQSTATVTDGEKSVSCDGLAKEPVKLMSMSAPQITGSCSSYARKTALGGLFALDNNEDPDSKDNASNKRSDEEVSVRQQILNRMATLTEQEKNGYREELKAGNWDMDQKFLNHLVKKYGAK
jgi:hypothetical protein